jgi:hypothetical protein
VSDGEAKEDGLARKNPVRVLDGFFHELFDDEGIRRVVDDGLFKISALEINFFNLFARQNELLLVGQTDSPFADTFVLKLGLNFQDLKIAEVRRDVIDGLVVGEREAGKSVITIEERECVVVNDIAGRGGETELDSIKIIKDFAVGVVNRTVTFVDDNEVEEMR